LLHVEKGDRQFWAFDVGIVTEAGKSDCWYAQAGQFVICVHGIALAARKGHRGSGSS
jgi:hypothetical protein